MLAEETVILPLSTNYSSADKLCVFFAVGPQGALRRSIRIVPVASAPDRGTNKLRGHGGRQRGSPGVVR
jgi:hypothetical protein